MVRGFSIHLTLLDLAASRPDLRVPLPLKRMRSMRHQTLQKKGRRWSAVDVLRLGIALQSEALMPIDARFR